MAWTMWAKEYVVNMYRYYELLLLQSTALFKKTYETKQKRKKSRFFYFEKTLKTNKNVKVINNTKA